ncbi:hypothetical protein, partial [Thermogutta sp.]|uniref:hypothetical protein n=1 Tax=Thermogutta sp. TaxID=1962930 RepID=UPI0025DAAE2A
FLSEPKFIPPNGCLTQYKQCFSFLWFDEGAPSIEVDAQKWQISGSFVLCAWDFRFARHGHCMISYSFPAASLFTVVSQ